MDAYISFRIQGRSADGRIKYGAQLGGFTIEKLLSDLDKAKPAGLNLETTNWRVEPADTKCQSRFLGAGCPCVNCRPATVPGSYPTLEALLRAQARHGLTNLNNLTVLFDEVALPGGRKARSSRSAPRTRKARRKTKGSRSRSRSRGTR